MISAKLMRVMESHQEEIIDRVAEQIRRNPDLLQTRNIPGVRQWHGELLRGVHSWLTKGDNEGLARRSQEIGRERFQQGIPLDESVLSICLLKQTLLDCVEANTFNKNSMELYVEEELDRRVGRFFDLLVVNLVRGYQSAAGRAIAA